MRVYSKGDTVQVRANVTLGPLLIGGRVCEVVDLNLYWVGEIVAAVYDVVDRADGTRIRVVGAEIAFVRSAAQR
jgi:hypothetical protein